MSLADTIVVGSKQINVTPARERTPNVRFPGTICSQFADKLARKSTGLEVAHIFPLSEKDIVSHF